MGGCTPFHHQSSTNPDAARTFPRVRVSVITIAVTAERHGEPRVALSPEAAKKLTALTGDLHHARPIHEILRHRPRHPVPGHHLRCALAAGLRLNESERRLGVPVDSIQPGADGCSQAEVSAVPRFNGRNGRLNLPNLITIVSTVATLMATGALVGRWLNMYPIEAAIINACHSGQEGTGDIAILMAAIACSSCRSPRSQPASECDHCDCRADPAVAPHLAGRKAQPIAKATWRASQISISIPISTTCAAGIKNRRLTVPRCAARKHRALRAKSTCLGFGCWEYCLMANVIGYF